ILVNYLNPTDHDKGTGVTQGFSLASVALTGSIFAQNPEKAYFPFITGKKGIVEEYAMRLDGRLALMSLGRFAKVSPDTIASIICLNPYVHDFVSSYRDKRGKLVADMGDTVEDRYQQAREFVGKELLDQAMMIRKRYSKSGKRTGALVRYPGDGSALSLTNPEVDEHLDWKSFEGAKIMKRLSLAEAIAFTEIMQESGLSLEDVGFAATTGYDLKLIGIAEALCNEKLNFPTGPLFKPLPSDFDTATLVLDIILRGEDDESEKIQSVIDGYITPCVESFPLELRERWFGESEELLSWKEAS
ncbi:MAG: hypothetical protein QF632_01490, partial [Candidatus Woesearchaeota archaeon]|nr:hypothetical protein [Candidatus Woesearchaeota archaeon]